ncbi:MAG: VCBS repeat-containing protein [Calditrichae bacterium]|nr:VCBS repeat-containing protein [Calditrichia bacterium]
MSARLRSLKSAISPVFISITLGFHYGGGIAVGDFNADGFEDLYVTNGKGKPNALFLNNGNGTFSDVAIAAGVADTLEGMGTVCADIDNDGDLDIFVSNHNAANRLYLNDGNAALQTLLQQPDWQYPDRAPALLWQILIMTAGWIFMY